MKRKLNLQHEVLLLCSLAWFLIFSAGLLPGMVLPLLREAFSMTLTQAGALMSLFWLTNALIQFPAGFLSDRCGAQRVIGIGLVLVVCGELLVAVAASFTFLLASFAILGVGLGSYPSAGTTLLARTFGPKKGRAFGIHSAISSLGGLIPLGVPLIIEWLSWRGLHVAFSLAAIPLAVAFLRTHQLVLLHSCESPADSARLRTLLVQPSLRWLALLTILFVSAWQGIIAFLPTFLVSERGLSLRQAGTVFSSIFLGGLLLRPLIGVLSDYVDRRRMLLLICILGASGTVVFLAAHSLGVLFVASLTLSTAGSFFLVKNGYLLDMLQGRDAATGLGLFNTLIMLSASQSSVLLGVVGDRYSLAHGLTLLVIFMVIAAILSLRLRRIPTEKEAASTR